MGAVASKRRNPSTNATDNITPGLLTPLWKATTYHNSNANGSDNTVTDTGSLPTPLTTQLSGARHKEIYIRQTLVTSSLPDGQALTIETGLPGGVLILRLRGDAQQIFAVARKYTLYNTTPYFEGQPPSKKSYKGTLLYEYAQLKPSSSSHRVVTLVGNEQARYTIVPGPLNSQSSALYDAQHAGGVHMVAEWKYQTESSRYTATIHQPGVDVALILFLALLQDMMDVDALMRKLGKQALIG